MSRFATTEKTRKPRLKKAKIVENRAGGKGYTQDSATKLVSILATSMFNDQAYRTAENTAKEVRELVALDPEFAAKAAIYARDNFNMRTITHIAAGEVAHNVKGEEWTKNFFTNVVVRVDDITEILAYYQSQYGKPFPNAMKKGLRAAFDKFDGYQLAKYRGEGKSMSLVDAVNLVRPRPTEANEEALAALVRDELRSTGTFESELSKAGQAENKEVAKKQAWAELLEGRIGQMALLRNLRNIAETKDKNLILQAANLVADENRVTRGAGARILPFRYLTAQNELNKAGIRAFDNALDKAITLSTKNVPNMDGRTLIAIDHSGSMGNGYGSFRQKADLFAAIVGKANEADVIIFASNAHMVELSWRGGVLKIANEIDNSYNPGWGTNFDKIFKAASSRYYDRIMIFSDMQSWMGDKYSKLYGASDKNATQRAFDQYRKRADADPFVYAFDLSGYGTAQFDPRGKLIQLAGYSDKVFDFVGLTESDKDAMIKTINAIDF